MPGRGVEGLAASTAARDKAARTARDAARAARVVRAANAAAGVWAEDRGVEKVADAAEQLPS